MTDRAGWVSRRFGATISQYPTDDLRVHAYGAGQCGEVQHPWQLRQVGGVRQQLPVHGDRVEGTVLRLLPQQLHDQRVQLVRYVRTVGSWGCRRLINLLLHHRERGVAGERLAAGEQLVQHAAHCVQVGLRAAHTAEDLLGRHVGGGADVLPGAGDARQFRVLQHHGEPEVEDLDRAVGFEHQVGGFEVTVHQRRPVSSGQYGAELRGDAGGPADGQGFLFGDEIGDADPVDALHDEVRTVLVGAHVVHGGHPGVAQARGDAGLAMEPANQFLVGVVVGEAHELDGDLAVKAHVAAGPDLAHAALGQHHRVKLVAAVDDRAFRRHLPPLRVLLI